MEILLYLGKINALCKFFEIREKIFVFI